MIPRHCGDVVIISKTLDYQTYCWRGRVALNLKDSKELHGDVLPVECEKRVPISLSPVVESGPIAGAVMHQKSQGFRSPLAREDATGHTKLHIIDKAQVRPCCLRKFQEEVIRVWDAGFSKVNDCPGS